jgi:hypothetical protein
MPSPFPGMDPFLEDPELFPDLHDCLVNTLRERLQAALPPPYYARLGRRVWIESSFRTIGPDVSTLRPRPVAPPPALPAGGIGLAEAPTSRAVVIRVPHDERQEPFIEIYSGRGEKRRLVTSIEVLSLANKSPGEHGRDLYLRKQQELLQEQVHLVEIDLLRGGRHTTAVPREMVVAVAGEFDYHVCVHRFDAFEEYVVYPILLHQPLPELDVPLLPGDGAVSVDVQEVFEHCYGAGAYDREVDYGGTLPAGLSERQEEWVRAQVARLSA